MAEPHEHPPLKPKDFASDQAVRWCPGCGDYAVLKTAQQAFAETGRARSEFAVISGIGCSSRFPYYLSTYGFHTIHGRAPSVALGLKVARPELSVWVITGDGDSLSIGGNHTIHALRRNLDINILLFNNRIYGLTKGQYSPTSELGKVTKSSPMGTVDHPFDPLSLALGAGATFVARSVDVQAKPLKSVLLGAYHHKGTSFVEIYQNCPIFNDDAFAVITDKPVRTERQIELEHGKPLVYGKKQEMALVLDRLRLRAVKRSDVSEAEILVHDTANREQAFLLAQMHWPEFPEPMGVFYQGQRATYEDLLLDQVSQAQKSKKADLTELVYGKNHWTVQ